MVFILISSSVWLQHINHVDKSSKPRQKAISAIVLTALPKRAEETEIKCLQVKEAEQY